MNDDRAFLERLLVGSLRATLYQDGQPVLRSGFVTDGWPASRR
jgi:hypothetical protein